MKKPHTLPVAQRDGMPPLVWREKIWVCPACLSIVGPDDSVCPFCGAEFETPVDRRVMRGRRVSTKEAIIQAIAVSTSILAGLFLLVALFLSDLHTWVPPVHENAPSYAAFLIMLILVSTYFELKNRNRIRAGHEIPRVAHVTPLAMIIICSTSLILIAFAREVDRMLVEGMYYVFIGVTISIALLALSFSRSLTGSHGKKSEN
jgi:hypothetical protein